MGSKLTLKEPMNIWKQHHSFFDFPDMASLDESLVSSCGPLNPPLAPLFTGKLKIVEDSFDPRSVPVVVDPDDPRSALDVVDSECFLCGNGVLACGVSKDPEEYGADWEDPGYEVGNDPTTIVEA